MAGLALLPAIVYYLVLNAGRAGEYFTYNTVEMLGMLLTSKFYAQWLALADRLVGLSLMPLAGVVWWKPVGIKALMLGVTALTGALFVLVGAVGLALNEGLLWLFTEPLGLHYLLSKAARKAGKIDKTAPATEKAPKGKGMKAQRGQ